MHNCAVCATLLYLPILTAAEAQHTSKLMQPSLSALLRTLVCQRIHPHAFCHFCSLAFSKYLASTPCKSCCTTEKPVHHSSSQSVMRLLQQGTFTWQYRTQHGKTFQDWVGTSSTAMCFWNLKLWGITSENTVPSTSEPTSRHTYEFKF